MRKIQNLNVSRTILLPLFLLQTKFAKFVDKEAGAARHCKSKLRPPGADERVLARVVRVGEGGERDRVEAVLKEPVVRLFGRFSFRAANEVSSLDCLNLLVLNLLIQCYKLTQSSLI